MRIFRTALSIALRHPIYLGVYVLFLSAIGSFITGSAVYVDEAAETYEPARASIAVVDRDGSELSRALRDHLATQNDVVDVSDESFALQDALATSQANVAVVVPEGFGDALLDAARTEGDLPSIEVAYGGYTQAAALAEQQALRWVSLAGAAAALEPDADMGAVVDLVADASGVRADIQVEAGEVSYGAAYPFQSYLSFTTYTLMCSVIVCVGLVFSKMSAPDLRSRMLGSPARPRRVSMHVFLACLVLTVAVWVVASAVGLLSGGLRIAVVAPAQVALALASMLVFALVPLSLAFTLAQLGVTEDGLNALGNIGGMVMSFLGGAWVPLSLMGSEVQAAARFSPAFWTNEAVSAVLTTPVVTADVLARVGCGMGVTALFAAAIASIGLAATRKR